MNIRKVCVLIAVISLSNGLIGCEVKRPAIPEGLKLPSDVAKLGQDTFYKYDCVNCHVLDGVGGKMGPSLVGIGTSRDADYLRKYIRNPQAVNRMSGMPKAALTEQELEAVVAFIATPR